MEIDKIADLFPILLFLLPGFVSVGIIEALCVCKSKDVFGRIIEALIFTILNLAGFLIARSLCESFANLSLSLAKPLSPLACRFGICLSQSTLSSLASHEFHFDRADFFTVGNVTLMASCAVAIGTVFAAEMNNEYFLGLLSRLHITRKTAKPSTWIETWTHARKFVVVHLNDGRRIYGWPTFYSDDPEERALFLEDASWLDENNRLINGASPISVFLDKQSGIKLVEFLENP